MDIQTIINLKPETLQFLVMAIIKDSYNTRAVEIVKRFLGFAISEKALNDLRMSTHVIVKADEIILEADGMLVLRCQFKGHGGYPGGEIDKDLGIHIARIKPEALNYLLISMPEEIKKQKTQYKFLLESANDE